MRNRPKRVESISVTFIDGLGITAITWSVNPDEPYIWTERTRPSESKYVAVYHWTKVLHQPYRIEIHDGSKTEFVYDLMKSDFVLGRVSQMKQFYE